MRWIIVGAALVLSATCVSQAAQPPAIPPGIAPELNPDLRGGWVIVGVEKNGKKLAGFSAAVWEFRAGQIIKKSSKSPTAFTTSKFVADATKNPKEINLTVGAAPPGGVANSLPGIYQVEGDTLKLCYSPLNKANNMRPNMFQTIANDGFTLYTLKRQN